MTELKYNGRYVFRTQRSFINPKPTKKEKEDKMTSQEIEDWIARMKDNQKQLAEEQPGSPPPVILAKTETQKRIEAWYEKPGTIKTNVNGVQGMESYAPPPCILSDPKEES